MSYHLKGYINIYQFASTDPVLFTNPSMISLPSIDPRELRRSPLERKTGRPDRVDEVARLSSGLRI